MLLYDGHADPLSPHRNLLHGSGAECVGSTEIHFFAGLFELIRQLTYGSCLPHSVHPDHENDVWLVAGRNIPVVVFLASVLRKQGRDFLTEDGIQFRSRDILVAGDTLLNALDDFQRGVHAHITRQEHLLEVVEHLVVDSRLAGNGTRNLVQHAGLGLFQPLVKRLFLVSVKQSENTHTIKLFYKSTKIFIKDATSGTI